MTGPDDGSGGNGQASRDERGSEEIRRHEAHLVGQIYHLIEANHRLEEQLHRLGKVTEIAEIFRQRKITRDTFELRPPKLQVPVVADSAWQRIDKILAGLDQLVAERLTKTRAEAATEPPSAPDADPRASEESESTAGQADVAAAQAEIARVRAEAHQACAVAAEELAAELETARADLIELRENLGMVREQAWQVDSDWLSDARTQLIAAAQAVAFLNEQSRELDMLRREKDSIMDGATRLEQNLEDLWKGLNEKTTHIQRLEAQLSQIWDSLPYRAYKTLTRPFRRGGSS